MNALKRIKEFFSDVRRVNPSNPCYYCGRAGCEGLTIRGGGASRRPVTCVVTAYRKKYGDDFGTDRMRVKS